MLGHCLPLFNKSIVIEKKKQINMVLINDPDNTHFFGLPTLGITQKHPNGMKDHMKRQTTDIIT